jgi:hypothetical protein
MVAYHGPISVTRSADREPPGAKRRAGVRPATMTARIAHERADTVPFMNNAG